MRPESPPLNAQNARLLDSTGRKSIQEKLVNDIRAISGSAEETEAHVSRWRAIREGRLAHIAIHRVLSFTVSFPATVSDSQRCRELYEGTVAMRGPKVKLEKAQRFISR
jgi:hypothetical protein